MKPGSIVEHGTNPIKYPHLNPLLALSLLAGRESLLKYACRNHFIQNDVTELSALTGQDFSLIRLTPVLSD